MSTVQSAHMLRTSSPPHPPAPCLVPVGLYSYLMTHIKEAVKGIYSGIISEHDVKHLYLPALMDSDVFMETSYCGAGRLFYTSASAGLMRSAAVLCFCYFCSPLEDGAGLISLAGTDLCPGCALNITLYAAASFLSDCDWQGFPPAFCWGSSCTVVRLCRTEAQDRDVVSSPLFSMFYKVTPYKKKKKEKKQEREK